MITEEELADELYSLFKNKTLRSFRKYLDKSIDKSLKLKGAPGILCEKGYIFFIDYEINLVIRYLKKFKKMQNFI